MKTLGKVLFVVLFAAVLVLFAWASIEEENRWQDFKVSHHCARSGHVAGETTMIYGTDGKMHWMTSSARDTWTCDGGYTETRDAE